MEWNNWKYDLIYLVDDFEVVNEVHKLLLEKMGIPQDIRSFSSAYEALDELEIDAKKDINILVLLDMAMPMMSGLEFLEHMVLNAFPLNIDVLIVTSSEQDNDRQLTLEYPQFVIGFIVKPLTEDFLKSTVIL